MKVYDGANWITATAAGTTAMLVYKYVATSGQTTFSGAASVGGTLSYTSNNIIVFVNGVSLDSTDYTATNGTSVVLASGAALNDEVVIVAFKSFTVADTYTKGEVDAFAVKLTGAQTVAGVKTFSSQPVMSAGVSLGSNGQIVFPATQNASSDANTLDDYEEGTFSPSISSDSTGAFTMTTRYGRYTKVGNLVTFVALIVWSARPSGGNIQVSGYPFSIDWGTNVQSASGFMIKSATDTYLINGLLTNDTNGLVNNTYAYSFTRSGLLVVNSLSSSGYIAYSGSYFTS